MHFSDVYEKNLHRRMSFPVSDEDEEGVSSGNYERRTIILSRAQLFLMIQFKLQTGVNIPLGWHQARVIDNY